MENEKGVAEVNISLLAHLFFYVTQIFMF